MTENKQTDGERRAFLPQGLMGRVALVGALLLAFFLGSLLTGNGEDSAHDHSVSSDSAEPTVWTCSMHPQIKLPEAGKCPLCFMDLIPLEAGDADELGPRQLKMTEAAKQNARIVTVAAKRGMAAAEISLIGKLAYDETRVAYITARAPGRLDHLFADFTGVEVRKGDPLVSLYSPELMATQQELLQAKGAVDALSDGSEALRGTVHKTLSAAREKLRLYGLTAEQIAEIENTETVSEHLTINAPLGGVVVHKNAAEGLYVTIGTRIYTIADLSALWVIFEAYETDIQWLRVGQTVEFTAQSFPGVTFEATIEFIDPALDQAKRTVQVRAVFDNSDGRLKPDMLVSGIVYSQIDAAGNVFDGRSDSDTSEDGALLIPASAALLTGKRAVVYVELPNGDEPLFEGREVELGPRAGDFYIVRSGIEAGDLVVVNGAFKLDAELQIRARPSMMSAESDDSEEELEISEPSAEIEALTISDAARSALTPVYQEYFKVQEALAADNFDLASSAVVALREVIGDVDMALFGGEAHVRWMELAAELSAAAATGAGASEIEGLRLAFYDLSKSLIALHESFGHADDREYFLTYCPMAMDYTGAFWLQTVDTVYNAFYGASMLHCGSIEDTLQPVQ